MSTAPLGQAPQARWKQTRSQISSSRYSHLQNVMDLRISQLVVAPIRVELHCTPTIDLPVSAVRFTHNTVDGHPVFLHDENAQSKKTSLWTFHICPSISHMSIDFHVLPGGATQSATGMPSGSAPDESGGLPHKDEPRIVKVGNRHAERKRAGRVWRTTT